MCTELTWICNKQNTDMKTVKSVWKGGARRLAFLSLLLGLLGMWGASTAYGQQRGNGIVDPSAFVTLWKPRSNSIVFPIQANNVKVLCYEKNGSTPSSSEFNKIQSKNYQYTPDAQHARNEIKTTYNNKPIAANKEYIVEVKCVNGDNLSVKLGADKMRTDANKDLYDILHWGTSKFVGMYDAFRGCSNLTVITADDAPSFTTWSGGTVVDNNGFFADCTALTKINNLSAWASEVSNVTTAAYMFSGCKAFKGEGLQNWQLSSVTNVTQMFRGCVALDVDLSNWGSYVTKCVDFSYLFDKCSAFAGKDLNKWKTGVRAGRNFTAMFRGCSTLNFDPSEWEMPFALEMGAMFEGCINFGNKKEIDFSKWVKYVKNVKKLAGMFNDCQEITGKGLDTWFKKEDKFRADDLSSMFYNCKKFNANLKDWDVTNIKQLNSTFSGCLVFKGEGLAGWDVSQVENMDRLFMNCKEMKQDLKDWKVGNVKSMRAMFSGSYPNTDFTNWDVSNCEDFSRMFAWAKIAPKNLKGWDVRKGVDFSQMFTTLSLFNEDLSKWKLNNAENTSFMFQGCSAFSANLKAWVVENIVDASYMFVGCTKFDADLSAWEFKKLKYMQGMFMNAHNFKSDISRWRVELVEDMAHLFRNTKITEKNPISMAFASDLSKWKVGACRNFSGMFYGCNNFNSDLSKWDTRKAENMSAMFFKAEKFNQDIGKWDVSLVDNMDSIFMGASAFNSDISGWNTGNLQTLFEAFRDAESFNYSLGQWNLKNMTGRTITLANCGMGIANYDRTLKGWNGNADNKDVKNVKVVADNLRFMQAESDRTALTNSPKSWSITGDSKGTKLLLIADPLKLRVKRGGQKSLKYEVKLANGAPQSMVATITYKPEGIVKQKSITSSLLTIEGEKAGRTHIRMQVDNEVDRAYDDCDVTCYVAITELNYKGENEVAIGDKLNLKRSLTVLPNDATDKDALKFTSLNTDIAEVDAQTGVLTGKKEGEVEIRVEATDDDERTDINASDVNKRPVHTIIKVKVYKVEAKQIKLYPLNDAWIGIGTELKLRVEFIPANTTDKTYEVTLSNDCVDKKTGTNDIVVGKKIGVCEVKVVSTSGNHIAKVKIHVVENYVAVDNVRLDQSSIRIPVRAEQQLTYNTRPANASNKTVYWTSNHPEIADVSSDGVVKGIAEGSAVIMVRSADNPTASDICSVEVYMKEVSSIEILDKDKRRNVAEGRKAGNLSYVIKPIDASNLDVEWESSDPTIVAVNKNTGELEGLKKGGPVTITAKALGATSTEVKDEHKQVYCIELIQVTDLILPPALTMTVDEVRENFDVKYNPANATDLDVRWEIEDEEVIEYNEITKMLMAKRVGESMITVSLASDPSIKAQCKVTVNPHVKAKNIRLMPKDVIVGVNQEIALSLVLIPYYATIADVEYEVVNEYNAISFDEMTRMVTGLKIGQATVKAMLKNDHSIFAESKITVREAKKTDNLTFDISPAVYTIEYGDAGELDLNTKLQFTPSDATDRWVDWVSASPDVVQVVGGYVRGLQPTSEGVEVTASLHSDKSKTAKCRIIVKAPNYPTSFRLDPMNLRIKVGEDRTIEAKDFEPEESNYRDLVWSTSDDKIVTVDQTGKVHAVAKGAAVITAKLRDRESVLSVCFVQVYEHNTTKLVTAIDVADMEVVIGTIKPITVTYDNENAEDKEVGFLYPKNDLIVISGKQVEGKNIGNPVSVRAYLKSDPQTVYKDFTITVIPVPKAEKFELSKTEMKLWEGTDAYLRTKVEPNNVDLSNVQWTSDDASVATVVDGVVHAVKEGVTDVHAKLGDKTATCKITVVAVTSQAVEDEQLRSIVVYPNPFASQLHFKNENWQVKSFELLDMTGRVVRSGVATADEVTVETSNLNAGVYLLHLHSENGIAVHKVVKQ